ncbi:MAG: hypothetical protein ACJA0V_004339 [Planctomycetota bacterium]
MSVVGLPKDLARERVALMFRSVVRENLQPWQVVLLGANDSSMLPVPPRGRCHRAADTTCASV